MTKADIVNEITEETGVEKQEIHDRGYRRQYSILRKSQFPKSRKSCGWSNQICNKIDNKRR